LTVVAQARGQIGQILLIEAPNRHETTAAISQNAVEDLQADLQKRAIVAQAKKVDRAFSSFLSTGKLIAEAGKYMAQTQKKWAEKAQVLNRAIHVVRELASQEVAIPNANVFDRKTVRGQREALTRELQTLHTLQGLDAPQGNFADSAALSPRMKEKACKVDELLGKTDAARTMAMSINSAKRAADIYEEAKRNLEGGIDDLFQKLILVSQSVEECQPESANQIDQELAQARETLESLRGDLEGIELMRGSLAKVIPGVDEFQALVAGVSNRFSEVSGRLTSIESRLRQLRTLETAFQNGTFDDLMLYHFRNVPESLYARLKDIVADKLKDLDTEEAQQYRAAVKNLLFRLGKGVEGKFDLPQLKRTWGEAFAAFFSWLVSLIFGQSKPVESAPVRLDRAEQPRQQLLQPQQARSEDAEEEIGDDLFDDSWDDLDFEPSNSSEMDDLRRYYGIAPSTNPIDEEVPSAAEAYRQKASANVVVTS
jgi:DNA repair exonuclease SbcCD ATPase subunit